MPRAISDLLIGYAPKSLAHKFASHRGSGKMGPIPENTALAFAYAFDNGIEINELDVRLSLDGVPVIFHGPYLEKNTSGVGTVEKNTFAYLKSLDWGFYTKTKLSEDTPYTPVPILTLEEYLQRFAYRGYTNIEIKRDLGNLTLGLEEAVVDLVKKYKLEDRVFFSSFHWFSLFRLKKLAPQVALGALFDKKWYYPLLFWFVLKTISPDFIHPKASLLTKNKVSKWKQEGYTIVTWGENKDDILLEYFSWGLDIAIVDDVTISKRVFLNQSLK